MHGSIASSSCLDCGARFELADVRAAPGRRRRRGSALRLRAPLKPDVVLFGELLPVAALQRAERLAAGADVLLCIGSSLEVYPVAGLPELTLSAGGRVAIITQGPTAFDRHCRRADAGRRGRGAGGAAGRSGARRLSGLSRRRPRTRPEARPRPGRARTRPSRAGRPPGGRRGRPGRPRPTGSRSSSQLLEPALECRRGRVGGELGERGVQRHQHLERRLPGAAVIEVEPGAQRQLLSGQRLLAPAEQAGQPGLGSEDPGAALAPLGQDQLSGVGPQPFGHLLAAAIAEAGDEQLMAADRVLVGVGGGQAEGVKRAVEHGQVRLELGSRLPRPATRRPWPRQPRGGRHRSPSPGPVATGVGSGSGSSLSLAGTAAPRAWRRSGAPSVADDEHVGWRRSPARPPRRAAGSGRPAGRGPRAPRSG